MAVPMAVRCGREARTVAGLSDDVDEEAAQNRRMIRNVQGVARQVSMNPGDGMDL